MSAYSNFSSFTLVEQKAAHSCPRSGHECRDSQFSVLGLQVLPEAHFNAKAQANWRSEASKAHKI